MKQREDILAENPILEVAKRYGLEPKPNGKSYVCLCPFHKEKTPSFNIDPEKGTFHCFGCQVGGSVIDFVSLKENISIGEAFRKLSSGSSDTQSDPTRNEPEAIYDYLDADGSLIHQVCRMPGKKFKQRRPDGKGGWFWDMKGVVRKLYRLPHVLKAKQQGHIIFICEGEKDVDAMVAKGFAATCNSGGAGKWAPQYSEALTGANVAIIADKDAPGRAHAELVAASITGKCKSIRVLELPDRGEREIKDAYDWLSAGGDPGELFALVENTPEFRSQHPILAVRKASDGDENAIRGEIIDILTNDKLSATEQRTRIAKAVVCDLTGRGAFFFHKDRRDFDSSMFFDNVRKRLERIRGDTFSAWLSERLRVNRADALFRFIIAEVETAALAGEHTTGILPEAYWASTTTAVYISNGDGQMVKITAGQHCTVDNGTDGILFPVGKTLAPWSLTDPRDPFETCAIFRNAHCCTNDGKELLRAWSFSIPTNPPNKPPLCAAGPVGSGKTKTVETIAIMYGLPFVGSKVEDTGEDDFWVSMDAGGLFTLDNADTKCKWLADTVATAATGGCSPRRKLYTDSETVTLRPRAWLAITTCNPTFAADAGLGDRLLPLRMDRSNEVTSDAALVSEVIKFRDSSLSFIVQTLAAALADRAPTPAGLNSRHPDFAEFAVKIGRALGRGSEVITALRQAEQDKSLFCIENDFIGAALISYLSSGETFSGTSAELLAKLRGVDSEMEDVSAKRVGKRIAALWPHIEKVFRARRAQDGHSKAMTFTLSMPDARPANADFAEFKTAFS